MSMFIYRKYFCCFESEIVSELVESKQSNNKTTPNKKFWFGHQILHVRWQPIDC